MDIFGCSLARKIGNTETFVDVEKAFHEIAQAVRAVAVDSGKAGQVSRKLQGVGAGAGNSIIFDELQNQIGTVEESVGVGSERAGHDKMNCER